MNPDQARVTVSRDGAVIIMRAPTDPELNAMKKNRIGYKMERGKTFSLDDKGLVACVKLARATILDAEGFEYAYNGENKPLNKDTVFTDDEVAFLSQQLDRKITVWHDVIRDVYMERAGKWWEDELAANEEETEKN